MANEVQTPPVAGGNPPQGKTQEQLFFEGLEGKYPELKGNREGLFKASREGYDSDHEELKKHREYAKKSQAEAEELNSILQSDPNLNDFFVDMYNLKREGKNPALAMARLKPIMQRYINGEVDDAEYQAEVERLTAEGQKAKAVESMYVSAFEKACKEEGVDPEEAYKRLKDVVGKQAENEEQAMAVAHGYLKMLQYDDAVNAAYVRGKNETYEEKHRGSKHGDGTPSGSSAPSQPAQRNNLTSASAENARKQREIFGH